jgi:murein DD-endopeptidase MepM/ murein hydrolase activator NlpD
LPPIHSFKKRESEIVDKLGVRLKNWGSAVVAFVRRTIQRGRQRFTVMFIPHSEKRIFNVQISVFTLLFFLLISTVLILAFIGFSTHFVTTNRQLVDVRRDLRQSDSSLQGYRDELGIMMRRFREYQGMSDEILSLVDTEWANVNRNAAGGSISTLVPAEQQENSNARDIRQIEDVAEYFRTAQQPMTDLLRYLETIKGFINQIRTGWPIAGKAGYITAHFGPALNPFAPGTWYLHKGIDIAWHPGTPILATADGEVVFVGSNPAAEYGNNVIVRHQYGYSTRYAHMSQIVVQTGQKVRRGQQVGNLGNTGMSLGYHLHYEVIIGGQVVDPKAYLDLSSYDGSGSSGVWNGR